MKTNKMVVRLKDKTLLKGTTSDFSPENNAFNLKLLNGEVVMIKMENMKAAFFVKTFNGNKNYQYSYTDTIPWGGHKVKVEFIDGEVMIGYTPYHLNGIKSLFVKPADLKGNNNNVYVVSSATKDITFL